MTSLRDSKRKEVKKNIIDAINNTILIKRAAIVDQLAQLYGVDFVKLHKHSIQTIITEVKKDIRTNQQYLDNSVCTSMNQSMTTTGTPLHGNQVSDIEQPVHTSETEWIMDGSNQTINGSTDLYNQLYTNEVIQSPIEHYQLQSSMFNKSHIQLEIANKAEQIQYLTLLENASMEGRDITEIIVQRHIQCHRSHLADFELYRGLPRIAANWDKVDPTIPGFVLPAGAPLYQKLNHKENNFRSQLMYISMILRSYPSLLTNCTDPLRWFYVELYMRSIRTLDESFLSLVQNEACELKLMKECVMWLMNEDPAMHQYNQTHLLSVILKNTHYEPADYYEYQLDYQIDTLPYQNQVDTHFQRNNHYSA